MRLGSKHLDLSVPQVMGILNITPDSFSDGGELMTDGRPALAAIIDRAAHMVAAGATLLDIGGESTRPGAKLVTSDEEIDRVMPVLDALVARFDAVLSIDTSNAVLIKLIGPAGAGLINDIRALQSPGALQAAADSGLAICLMHMQGMPATMQQAPVYRDVVGDILDFLRQRIAACIDAGIATDRLLIDPGFGFGKTLEHNLDLLARLRELAALELPLLVGVSRKRMLGAITGRSEKQREAAGIAAAMLAMQNGARIIRTHDVAGTVDAVKIWKAVHDVECKQRLTAAGE
ncbi:MAG TPA: dihydropteroate synthase [Candidatus Acidoferrum sp.]|nr:dihydropteroate synthase [Candidatus Acidoferrum sp.]